MSLVDKSTYTALLAMFRVRPRASALGRADVAERLLTECQLKTDLRGVQSLLRQFETETGIAIIPETCGYWTLTVNSTPEEFSAAARVANTLAAHGKSELDRAAKIAHAVDRLQAKKNKSRKISLAEAREIAKNISRKARERRQKYFDEESERQERLFT